MNPTLLLNTGVQSARIREWQVLPGRTHPVMTGRGGAEGFLFTAVRVVPARGRVEARGKFARKRTAEGEVNGDVKREKLEDGDQNREAVQEASGNDIVNDKQMES